MNYKRKQSRCDDICEDFPQYSRLFLICGKDFTEDDFVKHFSKFGRIDDIRLPKDHKTGERKGVAYLKFSKTSEAAGALEQMNGIILPPSNRPMKIMVAANRSDIQTDDDEQKYKRLFINIPRSHTENKINEHFSQFGRITDINIQRDRNTGEPKGFAYVKYHTFSEAAKAFEECDKQFRAIFAMPKWQNKRQETSYESNLNSLATSSSTVNMRASVISMMNTKPEGYTRVQFMCNPYLNQHLVENLFGLVPGMQMCKFYHDLMNNCGKGSVSYSNPVSAAYAVEKLNNFEYPPGSKIFVKPANIKFDAYDQNYHNIPKAVDNLKNAMSAATNSTAPDLAQLAEAIAQASKLIKMATAGASDDVIPDSKELNYCSVKLPPTQPLADIDSNVAKRCFLVCKPQPPPLTVLRDVFCRFGDLINVYTLPNKTVGYARYATEQAANDAIKTLHGAEICGVRMKVLEADEEINTKKRPRYE